MKVYQTTTLALILILSISSCDDCIVSNEIAEECPLLAGSRIIDINEEEEICFYNDVYRYQGKIYTVCQCCVCDKAGIPSDCEGNLLCDLSSECPEYIQFYEEAEFLFSVSNE